MKSKTKRIISLLLVVILVYSILPIQTVQVQAAGLSLQQLKDKFPQDAYWNGGNVDSYTWTPCASHSNCDYYGGCNCNSFSNAIQCHGFALKLGYDAFGTNPRNWSRAGAPYSYIDSLKPGDIVTSDSPYHTFFVIGVTSSSVTIGECNYGGRCRINWGRSINKATIAGYSGLAIYIAPATLNIDNHVHSYTSSVTTNPTCTSAGVRTYRCSCGSSYTESIAALGHDYTGDRLYETAHPHQISQRCVRYSSCGGFYWTGENYFLSDCSTCLAENPKQIHSSHSSASLSLGGADSQTIYFWSSGYYNGNCSYLWERSNSNILPIWGDWTEDNKLPLTITANSIGTTVLTVSIIDSDTEAVLSRKTINVTVGVSTSSLSVNTSNSATISTAGKMKYYEYTPSTSGTYVIYSTGSADTKVHLYNVSGTELDSNDDGGDNSNFRLEYNLTAGTKYIFGVKYYSSSTTGTIPFKFGNVYTVNYNANGGTGAPSSQKKDYGASITLSSTLPTRSGYTFKGWATSSSATSATYQPGDTYTANSSTTLYAVWKKVFYGDVNQDGVLDNNDILRMNKIRLGNVEATNWELFAGDLDGDGTITMDDIELLNAFILRKSTQFPVEQMKKMLMINTYPDKTDYCIGTQISTNGLSVILYYAETSECYYVTEYCDIVLPSTSSAGKKNVDISFGGLETQYQITVTSEHSYTYKTTKTPTTSATGILTGTCSKCSGTTTVTLPKLNTTDYGYQVTKSATCTATGTGRYTWKTTTYGSFYFDITIAKAAHSWKAATCTSAQTCSVCGTTSGSALGHSYNYKATKTPTTSATGTLTGTCSKCSGTTTATLPKLNTTDYSYSVRTAATCTGAGSGRYTWKTTTYGSFYFDVSISATGHNYSGGKCTRCGANDPNHVIDQNAPMIMVDTVNGKAGETVKVTVSMKNNPGIWGMDLVVNYDKTQLTLASVTNGTVFSSSEWTQGNLSGDKCILSYEASGLDNITTNGVLAALEFAVNKNATVDSFVNISLSYNAGDIINVNFDDVKVAIVPGGINIADFVYGDLNSDGLVNKKDSLLMKMYLADNTTTIDMQAADVYVDGNINKKDSLYLKQYLAGLDVELGA